MSDVVKEADFFEDLSIFVHGPDEPQRLLRTEREADFIRDVMVRLGDVGDEGLRHVDPRVDGPVDRLARRVVPIPRNELGFRGGRRFAGGVDHVRHELVGRCESNESGVGHPSRSGSKLDRGVGHIQ